MRDITKIIVHCAATKPSMNIGAEEIRQWHIERDWIDIGYHYVIRRDGEIEKGRDVMQAGAHAKGHNFSSIGVCLIGGINEDHEPDDNYTLKQYNSLIQLVKFLEMTFNTSELLGHRDLDGVTKACPCFDVRAWYEFETTKY